MLYRMAWWQVIQVSCAWTQWRGSNFGTRNQVTKVPGRVADWYIWTDLHCFVGMTLVWRQLSTTSRKGYSPHLKFVLYRGPFFDLYSFESSEILGENPSRNRRFGYPRSENLRGSSPKSGYHTEAPQSFWHYKRRENIAPNPWQTVALCFLWAGGSFCR